MLISRWIPVTELLPDNVDIDCRVAFECGLTGRGYYDPIQKQWYTIPQRKILVVKYWYEQPLPPS